MLSISTFTGPVIGADDKALNRADPAPVLIKLPLSGGKQSKCINPVSANVRSLRKIKQGNGITSEGGEYLDWVNREGSTEEKKFKLKPHSKKKLPLREYEKNTPTELQVQKN